MTATGVDNIRDVIPFPRVPGHAEFWFVYAYLDWLIYFILKKGEILFMYIKN